MKYGFTTIKVRNMDESLEFYKDLLQMEEVIKFSPRPGETIVFLKDAENSKIELIHHGAAAGLHEAESESPVSIGFIVDSIEKIVKTLEDKNIRITAGPLRTPGGQTMVFIKDPNGVEVEFIEGFTL